MTRPRGLGTKGQGTGTAGVEGGKGGAGEERRRRKKGGGTGGMGKTGTLSGNGQEKLTMCLYVKVGNNEEDAGQNSRLTLPFRWSVNPNLNIHLRALIRHLPLVFVLPFKVTDVISF